jgi:capsular polysaccharide biosynthesis protein
VELRDYLQILRRRWLSALIVGIVVLLVVAVVTGLMTKKYTATTRLFFAVQGTESVSDLAQGSTFAEKQMTSYAQVATSPLVLDSVIRELDLPTTATELAKSVSATVPTNTVIIEIAATTTDPSLAAAIANRSGWNWPESPAPWPRRRPADPAQSRQRHWPGRHPATRPHQTSCAT